MQGMIVAGEIIMAGEMIVAGKMIVAGAGGAAGGLGGAGGALKDDNAQYLGLGFSSNPECLLCTCLLGGTVTRGMA